MMRRRQPCVWNIQQPILWHELGLLNTQEDGLGTRLAGGELGEFDAGLGHAGHDWGSAFVPSAVASSPGAF